MIGIQKQTKRFSVGAIFLVFVFALLTHFNLGIYTVYAQASVSSSDRSVAATPPAGDTSGGTSTKSGDDMGNPLANGLMTVFKGLLYGLLVFLAFIGSVAASAFLYVLDVSHFQAIMANPVVWEMWKIVRDFMNLFFIFVLLLSAFYTIFQVDKYSYKNVLSKVIFGALFVNFSFPIARAIIDVGNVMMYSFITDIFGMTGGGLTSGILGTAGLADILVPNGFDKTYELKFYLIAIVCLFMFVVSFLTLALMMLYRLVMLPILVMFSPIGFVAGAIPGMDGYAKQWWDKLIKNVFFGPIAVFMMMISVKFLNVWGSSNAVKAGFSQAAVSSSDASGTLISGVVYMTIPVIFFWIAITSAEKMSSEAGGLANSFGSKFIKWAGGLPWRGTKELAKFGGRKVESKLAKAGGKWKYLSPTVVKSAFKDWSETGKHEDMLPIEMAQAQVQNEINHKMNRIAGSKVGRILGLHKDKADYEMLKQTSQMKKYEDEIKQRSGGEINEDTARIVLKEAIEEHNKAKFMAATAVLSRTNGLDNIVGDLTDDAKGITGNYLSVMEAQMDSLGIDKQLQYKHLHNLGETAKSKGDLAFGDVVSVNLVTGEWSPTEDHAAKVGDSFGKMKAQTRQDILHGRAFFEQNGGLVFDDDGNPVMEIEKDPKTGKAIIDPATGKPKKVQKKGAVWGDMHATGAELARLINDDDVNSSSRKRGDLAKSFKKAMAGAQDPATRANYANFIAAYNAPKNSDFRNYVWKTLGKDLKTWTVDPTI